MNILSAENISKSYSERWLFKNLTFGISRGEKVALVGINGTGKSTLLKVLGGLIEPDNGSVSTRNGIRAGYLVQQPDFSAGTTIREAVFREDNLVLSVSQAYEKAIMDPDFDADKLQEILIKMDELNAWDYEKTVSQVLSKLGLTNLDLKTEALSGGQKKRLALAQLLLSEPDLIILDEPTNHLDLEAIEWLENFLSDVNRTVIMVTHDRYFLDNVTSEIIELDKGQMYRYKGDYAYFLEKKSEREISEQSSIDKAKNRLVKELEWMRRMPKARGTKAKYRIDAFHELKEKASQDTGRKDLEINVQTSRQGNKVMELLDVSMDYDGKSMVDHFTYIFKKKDRIGIVGRNGIGKSTFLDILTGKLTPNGGEVVPGQTTRVGYYTQETADLDMNNRIIDEVKEIAEYITLGDGSTVSVSKFLEQFLFPPAMQYTPISKLSGGEKRRLQLLKVLVTSPNLLILDEPTNDLDIDTLNVLEEFLEAFDGSLVLVSHDRYFMDKLVEHLFVFEGEGKIRDFHGNYSDYRVDLEERERLALEKPKAEVTAPVATTKVEPVTPSAPKKKLSFKEQKEYDQLEKEINDLENLKADLMDKLNSGKGDHNQLTEWGRQLEQLGSEIDDKTLRWLSLAE